MRSLVAWLICALPLLGLSTGASAARPDPATLRAWVQEMKAAERGPFARIRWFCKDGTVLPPEPYACRPHGGGHQHGEWNERALALRAAGYRLANIYAGLDAQAWAAAPEAREALQQMLVEQFLISIDNGWILRRARYYRGAFQVEDEMDGARRLLLELAGRPEWLDRHYLALRLAVALLPHGQDTPSIIQVRQEAANLAKLDPGFARLRNKIHVRPELTDAPAVRAYARDQVDPELAAAAAALADLIEEVYSADPLPGLLERLGSRVADLPELKSILDQAERALAENEPPAVTLETTARLMAGIRDHIGRIRRPELRLEALELSAAAESEHFVAAAALSQTAAAASRRQQFRWLGHAALGAYGAGLISRRQHQALADTLASLAGERVALADYKDALEYLALAPGWGSQWMRFHVGEGVQTLSEVEPLAELFIPDQLRAGPLFLYAQRVDALLQDANRMAGVRNELFGTDLGAGLRALNPGLARGVLHTPAGHGLEQETFDPQGIYLLPETIAELPPVAGILTAGEGNPLSHVQLLARNLGIPNVGVDETLIAGLRAHQGKTVVLAVSPRGSVQLLEDKGQFDELLPRGAPERDILIRPDLAKLDLQDLDFRSLDALRAGDSGRVVGPKAAQLGELRHHYPEAVADGLAIPFGVFRRVLERPAPEGSATAFDWMAGQYDRLQALSPGSEQRQRETEAFRARLESWVQEQRLDPELEALLARRMQEVFGPDGSYGVFVRSDTNVEDLPGFTGAGLNLTVANVVGIAQVLGAIPRVWASPFTARAFAWRQSHMQDPEHVYPAVLLMRSVPADKSGVLVTKDVDSGRSGWLSVAVNEGVGGAVDGQAAESLRVELASGRVRIMADATAPLRRVVDPRGGLRKLPVSGAGEVLSEAEIRQLIDLARDLPRRFPPLTDARGEATPADIEFGFANGHLQLFQIRPFLESERAQASEYLNAMDSGLTDLEAVTVVLDQPPGDGDRR